MTIQRGKDLLEQSNPSASDLKKAITALEHDKKYVQNCIEVGFREKSSGEQVIAEISDILQQLQKKLKCSTN